MESGRRINETKQTIEQTHLDLFIYLFICGLFNDAVCSSD